MKRKGQFISLMTVFSLIFVTLSTVFGSIASITALERQISYNSGDMSKITETKLRASTFETRAPKEVNYTSNNLALEKTEWQGTAPGIEEARQNYLSELKTRLQDQISPIGGCTGPEIETIHLGESLTEYEIELTRDNITCENENTIASIRTSLGNSFIVNNQENRYVPALNYSSNYTRNLKQSFDSESLSREGKGTSTSCGGGSSSDARDEARDEASDDTKSFVDQLISQEKSDGDELSNNWVSIDIDNTKVAGSCSQLETDSEYDENLCYDPCASRDSNGTCQPDSSPGTKYNSTCTWEANEVELDFSITDSDSEYMTNEGIQTPSFKWKFTYSN